MSNANLFIVLSPFQIVCAQEARDSFCAGEYNHLVVIDREHVDSVAYHQKTEEIDKRWNLVTRINERKKRGFVKSIQRVYLTGVVAYRHKFCKGKVFLGDPLIKWFNFMGRLFGEEVTWLDDGAASINVLSKFLGTEVLKNRNLSTPKFFTIFGSDDLFQETQGAVQLNDMRHRRSKLSARPTRGNEFFFIGQWLSERGGYVSLMR